MTSRISTTEVPYSAQEMFDLVANVERYPEFLPWCVALRVIRRDVNDAGGDILAEMIVAYKVFREKFKSAVTLDNERKHIEAHYIDGPFRELRNRWRFEDRPDDGGSVVHFFIEFEFKNVLLQATARTVFEKAFARMTDAFVKRADELYGARPELGPSAPSPTK